MSKVFLLLAIGFGLLGRLMAAQQAGPMGREHLLLDFNWRFAFGHPSDPRLDFNTGVGYFSYLAKTGYGDGAAAPGFDDRAWRQLDLPHDWAVEQPFSEKASFSHGFKAIGRPFPNASVGWYRKSFTVPAADLGRRISLEFDGVFRNSTVWVNGHYLGTEPSGYQGFRYDVSNFLHYDGQPNVVAVRVDATMEEGWFYEGAGIYRHVWLTKTAPVHVAPHGTFVTTQLAGAAATATATTTVVNESPTPQTFELTQEVVDAAGQTVATGPAQPVTLAPYQTREVASRLALPGARLWSPDAPYLYRLVARVRQAGAPVDQTETRFGVRTLRFDANEGFFLNGRHLKLTGSNNHQDHAGVGVALPDALQDWRIAQLKAFGCNVYRCSHNPPTPELLDACDRLGMLVIDENRLMGTAAPALGYLRALMVRDRNHPSIIAWSIGNEEWGIESNVFGARIGAEMQAYAKTIDSTRAITAAISGGWGQGTSSVIDVMGFNYIGNGNTDAQHAKFPNQPSLGTEEGSTYATRGVYQDDSVHHHLVAYDRKPRSNWFSLEESWQHYAARPYLAGLCIWTGFDYRGEPTPFSWPSIASYFGMLDLCGFPKDDAYYLKSWWTTGPVLHLLPHWNWPGRVGQPIDVRAYSNCDEVELFLNKKSLGKQSMPRNGHLAWAVPYAPGRLEAVGYRQGKKVLTDAVETTGVAAGLALVPDQPTLRADREDVRVITVRVQDKSRRFVPTADADVAFELSGPGRILGVGNGDPASLEPDQFLPTVKTVAVGPLVKRAVEGLAPAPELLAANSDAAGWAPAYAARPAAALPKAYAYRGSFELAALEPAAVVTFFYRSLGPQQSIYLNGKLLAENLPARPAGDVLRLARADLRAGRNTLVIVATPFVKKHSWESVNTDPGQLQIATPAAPWHRRAFNGLAQVLVQSTGAAGPLVLTATAPGLKPAALRLPTTAALPRPALL